MLPLQGVRVVEFCQVLAGPFAGCLLADMGADVIKIESPEGDLMRQWPPILDGYSQYFASVNRNKRSVVLDLKLPEDIAALNKLCESADILIQNLRPGVVDEIGIGPEAMLARHPRLIYCSIWAFGYEGPLRMKPGFDPLLQAYGGMMSVTGRPEDPPTFCGASINDKATGMFCTIGALAALRMRDKTGKGCLVDTSLFDSAVHWVEGSVNNYLASGAVSKRHGTGSPGIVPYQTFDTARPFDSRQLVHNLNRIWSAEQLDGPDDSPELRRARALRGVVTEADHILDIHSTSQDGMSAVDGAPKRLRLSSRRQRAAPMSCRPGVERDGAEAIRQRVTHTLCGGAGWGLSRSAGTPLFSAASERRRPAVASVARCACECAGSPRTTAIPGQRRPSSRTQNTSSSRRAVTISRRAGSNEAARAGA